MNLIEALAASNIGVASMDGFLFTSDDRMFYRGTEDTVDDGIDALNQEFIKQGWSCKPLNMEVEE